MAITTVTITTPDGVDPFNEAAPYNYPDKTKRVIRFIARLRSIIGGSRLGGGATLRYGTAAASATVTCATPVAANTVTINNKACTAIQLHARATATFSTLVAGNIVNVNGVAFTARASPSGANEFALGVSDTAAATNLAAAVNSHPTLRLVLTATSAAAVVRFRAYAAGTAGNALTLDKTGGPITLSATLLAGGAAASGDQWDYGDSDTEAATSLAYCIANSTTAGLAGIATATSAAAVVTVSCPKKGLVGNAVTLASSGATVAVSAARLAGGTETAVTF